MNCDEAFDGLTDPARRNSDELKWHLDLCARCRQMRDVLSPAIDLFDVREPAPPAPAAFGDGESDPPDSARTAALSPEALQIAERTAADLRALSRRTKARRRERSGRWVRFVAVFLLGAVVMFTATAWPGMNRKSSDSSPKPDDATACLMPPHNAEDDLRENAGSRDVVLRCVACHLRRPE